VLKRGGTLVSAVGLPSEETANKLGVGAARVMFPQDLQSIILQVTSLVEEGKLKAHIRKTFYMDEAAEAQHFANLNKDVDGSSSILLINPVELQKSKG
jgi:NADPH:quinone reductase-like Zn-dependent oxidoreductase